MDFKRIYIMLLLGVVLLALMMEEPDLEAPPLVNPTLPTLSPPSSLSRASTGTQNLLSKPKPDLDFDYYKGKCDSVLTTVNSVMARIVSENNNVPAHLLRLMFHDCFIHGCDGSILLRESTGNQSQKAEILGAPNKTLKGFQYIDQIKEKLEKECPGIVSCSDILVLATRDALTLSGGPYFPVVMGRRDSTDSYFQLSEAEIPRPNGNISETLRLFNSRQFSHRETVVLLGSHNIGKIDCQFIIPRLSNFDGTTQPDPTLSPEFLAELRVQCPENAQISLSSGTIFGPNYYQRLVQGRGLLFADQQLMAHNETAKIVKEYAADPTGRTFVADFAKAMTKMSQLGIIRAPHGEVRLTCSSKNINDTNITGKSAAGMNMKINMFNSVIFILCLWVSRFLWAAAY